MSRRVVGVVEGKMRRLMRGGLAGVKSFGVGLRRVVGLRMSWGGLVGVPGWRGWRVYVVETEDGEAEAEVAGTNKYSGLRHDDGG
jgi:hypothetical protein